MKKITDPEPFDSFSIAGRAGIDMLSTSGFHEHRTCSSGSGVRQGPRQMPNNELNERPSIPFYE